LAGPQKSGEILLEIIMRRYENRSTMMTSNRPIEEWGKLLSDVPAASAILARLLHHAEIIPISGRSYRLQPKVKRGTPSERSAASSSSSKGWQGRGAVDPNTGFSRANLPVPLQSTRATRRTKTTDPDQFQTGRTLAGAQEIGSIKAD
jgi:hypothetical protein